MRLLISDANILLDIEVGGLLSPMFSLDFQFAVPDLLYWEELQEQHSHLVELGLQLHPMSEKDLERVAALSQTYARASRNDLFALALAEVENCPLLTGDAALREAARNEQVIVKGTVWLVEQMITQQRITVAVARAAIQKMQSNKRWLPWEAFETMFTRLEKAA